MIEKLKLKKRTSGTEQIQTKKKYFSVYIILAIKLT